MRLPLPLVYALLSGAALAQLLPVFPVVSRWKAAPEVRRWVALWCVVFFVADLSQLAVSRLRYENLWLFKFINPVEDGLILWVLSFWQVKALSRIAFRVAIPLVVTTYLVIALTADDPATFQAFAGPFRGLVVLAAALFTLLTRVAHEPEQVLRRDWFWTTMGVALYYGVFVATEPIAAAIGATARDALIALFAVKALLDIVAFTLIWVGMRCPLQNGFSGST